MCIHEKPSIYSGVFCSHATILYFFLPVSIQSYEPNLTTVKKEEEKD